MQSAIEQEPSLQRTDGLLTVYIDGEQIQPWVNAIPVHLPGTKQPTLLTVGSIDTSRMGSNYTLRDPETGSLYFAKRYTVEPHDKRVIGVRQRASQRELRIGNMVRDVPGIPHILGHIINTDAYYDTNSPWHKVFILVNEYIEHVRPFQANMDMLQHPGWAIQKVIDPLLSILQGLHDRGIIHTDVKPSNLLLHDYDGDILLSDFGISAVRKNGRNSSYAKDLRHLNLTGGSVEFMDPRLIHEHTNEALPNAQSDLYSVGKMLYWILGNSPQLTKSTKVLDDNEELRWRNLPVTRNDISNNLQFLFNVPQPLLHVVMSAIDYQFSSAQEMQEALQIAMQDPEVIQWLEKQEIQRNLSLQLPPSESHVPASPPPSRRKGILSWLSH